MSWTKPIDPRVKIASLFSGTIVILLAQSLTMLVVIELLLILLILDHRAFGSWLRLLRVAGLFLLIIWGINYYLVTAGDLLSATNAVVRVLCFFTIFFLFSSSVEPDVLGQALTTLKMPYSLSWQLATAYRFIPLFEDESRRIVNAQLSRGVPLDRGLISRFKGIIALVIPFLTGTLIKSEQLAEALVARAWDPHAPRTCLYPLRMVARDYVALASLVLGVATFTVFSGLVR